ncbi:TIGR03862 family flavoprotein [Acidisoma cellulosilytica]|uniref:TIGR03862 family flavoprotein n=1 Tax=Acidisoma cellulosilyticum TaxID=2802395 RepID=A0A963YXN8_9PROT|nr:TIGR03862 family flavoprotein [Acidisoma cellulosilyticum]MCB8878989.1 TIGR03862 family flavoprotein [Acidisoma cellulosilyticum]
MIAVIGAGPAGLMAAETLAQAGEAVTVFDQMPSVGRKFLLAGRGGLNLTHSEILPNFLNRYGSDASPQLIDAVRAYPPERLRIWAEGLGQTLFVGSSGRVFPKAMKASPLLRAWLQRLATLGVTFRLRQRWLGFADDGALLFEGAEPLRAEGVVLALGGASWPKLGSDGHWTAVLAENGIPTTPLRPANAGLRIGWTEHFREKFAGTPLKSVAMRWQDRVSRGDGIISTYGMEGGLVYPLTSALHEATASGGKVEVAIDLRPELSEPALAEKLRQIRPRDSLSTGLKRCLALAPNAISLLREVSRDLPRDPGPLAHLIKHLPLTVTGTEGLGRAISTAGGVSWDEIDGRFMLKQLPGVFVAGEMLDWDAPTGGYLLQASFATGFAAGQGMLDWRKPG